jgi:hypothetical protein
VTAAASLICNGDNTLCDGVCTPPARSAATLGVVRNRFRGLLTVFVWRHKCQRLTMRLRAPYKLDSLSHNFSMLHTTRALPRVLARVEIIGHLLPES